MVIERNFQPRAVSTLERFIKHKKCCIERYRDAESGSLGETSSKLDEMEMGVLKALLYYMITQESSLYHGRRESRKNCFYHKSLAVVRVQLSNEWRLICEWCKNDPIFDTIGAKIEPL